MAESKIRLYVKSVRTVTGTVEVEHARLREVHAVETEPKHEFILSEDQQKIVEIVQNISRRHSFEVEVVDVTRENFLRRMIKEKQEKIKTFPTLITDSGRRIEGEMTEEQVESFLSKIANERRKQYL
jgi:NADP-dependent 3-hydroxy acid dehydrogenase YdfG